MVPVDLIALIIAHTREEYTAGFSLLQNIFDYFGTPVVIVSVIQRIFPDADCPGRTKNNASMAANTVIFIRDDLVFIRIIVVYIEAALVNADLTLYTALYVSFNYESGR
jgi:hypothetical protein